MANVPGVVLDGTVKITDPVAVTFIQKAMVTDGIANLSDWLTRFIHERAIDLNGQSAGNQTAASTARKAAKGFQLL